MQAERFKVFRETVDKRKMDDHTTRQWLSIEEIRLNLEKERLPIERDRYDVERRLINPFLLL